MPAERPRRSRARRVARGVLVVVAFFLVAGVLASIIGPHGAGPTKKAVAAPAVTAGRRASHQAVAAKSRVTHHLETRHLHRLTQSRSAAQRAYRDSVAKITGDLSQNLTALTDVSEQASSDSSLLSDPEWKTKAVIVLAELKLDAGQIRALSAPPGCKDAQHVLREIADNVDKAATNFARGIDHSDAGDLSQASAELARIPRLAGKCAALLPRPGGTDAG